jgi:hypothetical protein
MNLTAKEMKTLRSHHFGFCLFCAGIYGYAKRKGIDDRMLPKYVLNRAKDSLAILRSHIYT